MADSESGSNGCESFSNIIVKETPKFDLESYIGNYAGRTKLERLVFIGECSAPLRIEALKAAVIEAKKGSDVRRYNLALDRLVDVSPGEPEAVFDERWVDQTSKQNKAQEAKLLGELKEYKNNLIKESIRMGNEDAGKFYHKTGDLDQAFEYFSKMRSDASMNNHIITLSKHLVDVAIEKKDWMQVLTNAHKIQVIPQSPEDERITFIKSFGKAASGIANLSAGKYLEAAQYFLSIDAGIGNALSTTVSPNDIAIYGGLCALASMDRKQLQRSVLENSSFRTYLELEPHIRRAITFFVNSRYSSCLNILEGYRNDYLLDIHLQRQVSEIYLLIRSKSIIQYFIPFSCVTLDSLNDAFGVPGSSLEKELISMIKRGTLDARIDTQTRTLVHVSKNARVELQKSTIETAKAHEREMCQRLIRMNIIGAGLEVPSMKKGGLVGTVDWA